MTRNHVILLLILITTSIASGATIHIGEVEYRDAVPVRIQGDRVTIRHSGGIGSFRLTEFSRAEQGVILEELKLPPDYMQRLRELERKAAETATKAAEAHRHEEEVKADEKAQRLAAKSRMVRIFDPHISGFRMGMVIVEAKIIANVPQHVNFSPRLTIRVKNKETGKDQMVVTSVRFEKDLPELTIARPNVTNTFFCVIGGPQPDGRLLKLSGTCHVQIHAADAEKGERLSNALLECVDIDREPEIGPNTAKKYLHKENSWVESGVSFKNGYLFIPPDVPYQEDKLTGANVFLSKSTRKMAFGILNGKRVYPESIPATMAYPFEKARESTRILRDSDIRENQQTILCFATDASLLGVLQDRTFVRLSPNCGRYVYNSRGSGWVGVSLVPQSTSRSP